MARLLDSQEEFTSQSVVTELQDGEDNEGHFKQITGIIMGVCWIGFFGNAFALIVICHYKQMRNRQGMALIINQCAIDLVASVTTGAFHAVQFQYGDRVMPLGGLGGELMCRLFTVVPHWGTLLSSTYNLVAVTSERYLMLVHPIYHKAKVSRRNIRLLIALIWMVGPVYAGLFSIPTGTLADNRQCIATWPSSGWRKFYGVLTSLLSFVVPAILMVCMYGRIILTLRLKILPREGVQGSEAGSSRQVKVSHIQRNLLKTLLIVTLCFIGCWGPNQTYYFLFNMSNQSIAAGQAFEAFSTILVVANLGINPFIYVFKYREFRKGVRFLFRSYGVTHFTGESRMREDGSGTVSTSTRSKQRNFFGTERTDTTL